MNADSDGIAGDRAGEATHLLAALETYRVARQALLVTLGLPSSNRDPLAEFSERLVAALTRGELAGSRGQAGYDVTLGNDELVQVRYLANPAGVWVNEHNVQRVYGVQWYALVLFEAFVVVGVLAFPMAGLATVGHALGKRHRRREDTLPFTRRNWWSIRDHPESYRAMGVKVWLPPFD